MRPVLEHQSLNPVQFVWRESEVPHERDWVQPELRREIVSIDVNMRRLVRLMTVEIQTIRAAAKNRRHWTRDAPVATDTVILTHPHLS